MIRVKKMIRKDRTRVKKHVVRLTGIGLGKRLK